MNNSHFLSEQLHYGRTVHDDEHHRKISAGADRAVKTVLVVDDNHDSAFVVALLLETMGFQCRTAHSGAEAVAEVKRERPGAVLLDIGLPDIDGYAVAQRIATDVANPPPLIAVTGYGQNKDRQRALEAGFLAHVTKPVDPDRLERMLQSILAD